MRLRTLPEGVKIAFACFIGGGVFVAIALALMPALKWLAFVAGGSVGYLGYDFREVLQATPEAARRAKDGATTRVAKALDAIRIWFKTPHPFFYPALITTPAMYVAVALLLGKEPISAAYSGLGEPALMTGLLAEAVIIPVLASYGLLLSFARTGAETEKHYFERFTGYAKERVEGEGLTYTTLTYKNAYVWVAKGAIESVFGFGRFLKEAVGFVAGVVAIPFKFGFHLFRLIHSNKRLLCAVDSVIGGIITAFAFHYFAVPLTWLTYGFTILCGGAVSAVVGLINWELVSVRLLHVQTKNATS